MSASKAEVVVVGGGAAGIGAARRLHDAGIDTLLIEARSRLGGRAFTSIEGGYPVDLGCGWFHSAEQNPWPSIAQAQGHAVDKTRPPWQRPSNTAGFPVAEQQEFQRARNSFHERMEHADLTGADLPTSIFLDPSSRWNPLINATNIYVTGAEADKVSTRDLMAYEDTEENWRAPDGYGTIVAAHGAGLQAAGLQTTRLNVAFNCVAEKIDWAGKQTRVQTSAGVIEADRIVVALPSAVLAQRPEIFAPLLPDKTEAAIGLPLGLADKLFFSLANAEEFDTESRAFGRKDRTATAIYHMRPFGRPLIECYFGGACADELEIGGQAAFADFAAAELADLFGNDFRRRLSALPMHLWRSDRLARGSYSYATPGNAGCRAMLASPVADRLYFAGEACSPNFFSTAHGAYLSGITAAEQIIASRR